MQSKCITLLTANYHKIIRRFRKSNRNGIKDISKERASEKISFLNITSQPRKLYQQLCSWFKQNGRRYSPFTTNIERLVPFRTLTGRQSYYIDHEVFQQFGESLPVYKTNITANGIWYQR